MTALPFEALALDARPAPAGWVTLCRLDELLPQRGVAALVGGAQIAVFRLWNDTVLAVGNRDPFSHSNVISRGIVGTRGEAAVVASPMYKQVFDLHTGICLDSPEASLPVYPVRVIDGVVYVVDDNKEATNPEV